MNIVIWGVWISEDLDSWSLDKWFSTVYIILWWGEDYKHWT